MRGEDTVVDDERNLGLGTEGRDGGGVVGAGIGLDDGDVVEVLEGDLKPGDKVIVNEIRPVESAKSAPIQSPFNQGGQRGGGMRRP